MPRIDEDLETIEKTVSLLKQTESDDDQYSDVPTDAEDNVSIDSDDDVENESILDRISALQDALPVTLFKKTMNIVEEGINAGKKVWAVAGSFAWVVATGATIIILPLAMEIEREQAAVQQESQMMLQQQQAQALVNDSSKK